MSNPVIRTAINAVCFIYILRVRRKAHTLALDCPMQLILLHHGVLNAAGPVLRPIKPKTLHTCLFVNMSLHR